MLSVCKNLMQLRINGVRKCEVQSSLSNLGLFSVRSDDLCRTHQKQNFHTSTPRKKGDVQLEIRKAAKAVAKTKATVIEDYSAFDTEEEKRKRIFPTHDLEETVFGGFCFKDIPIVNIKVTKNNTIMSLVDGDRVKLCRSCGTENFKNARKGTNLAAQTTGISFGLRALKKGYKIARVVIKGLGPGRLSGIKGLQLAGMNIVSITDETKDFTNLRPRKQRRI